MTLLRFENLLTREALNITYFLSITAWSVALILLIIRFFIPWLNQLTTYGKLSSFKTPSKHDVLAKFFVPHEWVFTSCYIVGTAITLPIIAFVAKTVSISSHTAVLWILLLYQIHLARRLYECFFIHKFSHRMTHPLNFLMAIAYYIFAPISLATDVELTFGRESLNSLYLLMGLGIFAYGNYMQHACHKILASLRKAPSDNEYKIPNESWFKTLTTPHYFAEILIYVSFIVITSGKCITLWLILAFAFVNLADSATKTHLWYKSKIGISSAKNIIIPWIY